MIESGCDKACGASEEEANLPDPSTLTSIKTFQPDESLAAGQIIEEELKIKRKHDNEDDDFDAPKVRIQIQKILIHFFAIIFSR